MYFGPLKNFLFLSILPLYLPLASLLPPCFSTYVTLASPIPSCLCTFLLPFQLPLASPIPSGLFNFLLPLHLCLAPHRCTGYFSYLTILLVGFLALPHVCLISQPPLLDRIVCLSSLKLCGIYNLSTIVEDIWPLCLPLEWEFWPLYLLRISYSQFIPLSQLYIQSLIPSVNSFPSQNFTLSCS